MRKLIVIGLFLTFIITACTQGKNNTNMLSLLGLGGFSSTGTFTKQFSATPSEEGSSPFQHLYDEKTQYLYTAAEIGGSGKITRIRMRGENIIASDVTCPNMTVKMGHTNLTALTGTCSGNTTTGQGGEHIVLDNKNITIPAATAGTWFEIPLDTPFEYNGVDNLVVDIEITTKCTQDVHTTIFVNDGRSVNWYASDSITNHADYNTSLIVTPSFSQPWMQFVFSGGDNSIKYTDVPNLTNLASYPFEAHANKVQLLYAAGEINGSGYITGIGFPIGTSPRGGTTVAERKYKINVRVGHTSLTELTLNSANNFNVGAPVVMASSIIFTIPAGLPDGTYVWIPLPYGTFRYNGTNNLIVEINNISPSTGVTYLIKDESGINTRLSEDYIDYDAPILSGSRYFTKFRFNGATMDVITDGHSSTVILNTVASGRLNLYRASELGSAGAITSIYCRLYGSSNAAVYQNFRVIIGHSNVAVLSATSADNFMDYSAATIAAHGAVSVPAGLVKGDWLEIPLSRNFVYDGKSNLAVWLGTTEVPGPAVGNSCSLSTSNPTRYPGQTAGGIPGSASVGPMSDDKFDMKFKISK